MRNRIKAPVAITSEYGYIVSSVLLKIEDTD